MKLQPQATDLEEAVLGAMLLDRDAVEAVLPTLTSESFYLESHRVIYEAMESLFRDNKPIDLLTVTERLKRDGNLDIAGQPYYITELTNRVSSSAHVEEHARVIVEKQILRMLISVSALVTKMAYDETEDPFDVLDKANQLVEEINDLLRGQQSTPEISRLLSERIKTLDALSRTEGDLLGVPTGFHRLDSFTGGWQNTDLIIIAARPSMGKTAFMLSLADNASKAGYPVGIASLEMGREQLTDRLICSNAGINSQKLRRPADITAVEWSNMMGVNLSNIFINDNADISIRAFRIWAKEMVKKKGCKMLMLDYLQLMEGARKSNDNRETEVSAISRGLKQCAKELRVPVIALSQLNRATEARSDGRPRLSDLRESGAIEQDADFVGFLYRPEYYKIKEDEMGNSTQGVAELIIEKNRNGALGEARFRWVAEYMQFKDPEAGFVPVNQNGHGEGKTPF